jgi:hypothetical protein
MSNEAPQKPAGRRWPLWIALAVVIAGAAILLDPTHTLKGWLQGEPFYEGRPRSYWRKAIVSQDPAEQAQAEQAIRAGRAAAAPLLAEMLHGAAGNDWSAAQVRWKSAELLGAIGPPARPHAELALVDALDDEDPHVRKVVAQAIESVGVEDPRCVPPLIEMLGNEDTRVRREAARALGSMGPQARQAIPQIETLLQDPAEMVREAAATALRSIDPQREPPP